MGNPDLRKTPIHLPGHRRAARACAIGLPESGSVSLEAVTEWASSTAQVPREWPLQGVTPGDSPPPVVADRAPAASRRRATRSAAGAAPPPACLRVHGRREVAPQPSRGALWRIDLAAKTGWHRLEGDARTYRSARPPAASRLPAASCRPGAIPAVAEPPRGPASPRREDAESRLHGRGAGWPSVETPRRESGPHADTRGTSRPPPRG